MTITEDHRQEALAALDGMAEIVRNEMLAREGYVTDVQDEELAESGAICGGRKACAVGAYLLGGGVRPRFEPYEGWSLPGAFPCSRSSYMRRHPGLKLGYDALNEVSERYAKEREIDTSFAADYFSATDALEELFETCPPGKDRFEYSESIVPNDDMLEIIAEARRLVEAS